MTDRIEIDYARLQQIIQRLQSRYEELEQHKNHLIDKLRELEPNWTGKAAYKFFTEMADQAMPAFLRLMDALSKAQSALAQIANLMRTAEEQASSLFKSTGMTGEFRAVGASAGLGASGKLVDGGIYGRDGKPLTGKPDVIFTPGIFTTPESFAKHLEQMGARHPNGTFAAIYNQSDGLSDIGQATDDKLQARFGMRAGDNLAVATQVVQIKQAIADGRPLILEAHSQGGAITSAALMEVYRANPNADLSKITVNTYGSAGINFPPGPRYTHYVIAGDPVPTISGADIPFLASREYLDNVVVLPATRFIDTHSMEAYYEGIEARNNGIPSIDRGQIIVDKTIDVAKDVATGVAETVTDVANEVANTVSDISTGAVNAGKRIYQRSP